MTSLQLYLAPLRGFTDYIYRNTFTGHFDGFDGALAPFIPTVSADRFKPSHFKDVLPENNSTMPIVPQIISNQPDDFINLAVRLHDLGYPSVNWNLGCPFPMVAKKAARFRIAALSGKDRRLSGKNRSGYPQPAFHQDPIGPQNNR